MLTISRTWNPNARRRRLQTLPMIRIRGRWLQQLGFRSGERIVVTIEKRRIVLTLAPSKE